MRLLLILIVVGVILYLVKTQGLLHTAPAAAGGPGSPVERARAAARASDTRTASGEAMGKESNQDQGAVGVTENMTPEQVRHLIGSPDETSTATTGSGATRETWVYRSVGKTVIFENGVVVSVQ